MRYAPLLCLLLATSCVTTASNPPTKPANPGLTIDELEAASGETDDTRFEARYDAAKKLRSACQGPGNPDPVPCQLRVDGALEAYVLKSARARPDPDDAYWTVKFALLTEKPSAEVIALARQTSAARAQRKQDDFDKTRSYKKGANCVFASKPFSESGDKNPDLTYYVTGKTPKIFFQCHADAELKNLVGRLGKLVLRLREVKSGGVNELQLGPPDRVAGSIMRGEISFSFSNPALNATSIYATLDFDSVVGVEEDTTSSTPAVRDKWESQKVAASAFFWDPNAS